MQRTIEEINPTKKRFTVEVPAEVLEERITDALRRIGERARVPGFRPGKIPLTLLERRFGRDAEAEVLEKIIPEYYMKALSEENAIPVMPPVFESYDFKRNSPLKLVFTVETQPDIGELRYEGLKVQDEDVEVTDEDVEDIIVRLQMEKSTYEKVEDEIEDGDLVVVDYRIVEEGQGVKNQYIKVGSNLIPVEISEALKGKKPGETFEVTAGFPEDYINKNLGGKTLTLTGNITEVKRLRIAELDENFFRDLGVDNEEALRETVRGSILRAKREAVEAKQKAGLIEQIIGGHTFPLPEGPLEAEINALTEETKVKNPEEAERIDTEEIRKKAERNIKLNILLDTIARRENISVGEEELKNKILELSQRMHTIPENFIQMYFPTESAFYEFRQNNIRQKAVDYIFSRSVREKMEESVAQNEPPPAETEVKGERE